MLAKANYLHTYMSDGAIISGLIKNIHLNGILDRQKPITLICTRIIPIRISIHY